MIGAIMGGYVRADPTDKNHIRLCVPKVCVAC
jgi:hypothetical protein